MTREPQSGSSRGNLRSARTPPVGGTRRPRRLSVSDKAHFCGKEHLVIGTAPLPLPRVGRLLKARLNAAASPQFTIPREASHEATRPSEGAGPRSDPTGTGQGPTCQQPHTISLTKRQMGHRAQVWDPESRADGLASHIPVARASFPAGPASVSLSGREGGTRSTSKHIFSSQHCASHTPGTPISRHRAPSEATAK